MILVRKDLVVDNIVYSDSLVKVIKVRISAKYGNKISVLPPSQCLIFLLFKSHYRNFYM